MARNLLAMQVLYQQVGLPFSFGFSNYREKFGPEAAFFLRIFASGCPSLWAMKPERAHVHLKISLKFCPINL